MKISKLVTFSLFHINFLYLLYISKIGERSDVLQKAVVNVWNSEKCQELFQENANGLMLTERQICAGHAKGGIDSCWVILYRIIIMQVKV